MIEPFGAAPPRAAARAPWGVAALLLAASDALAARLGAVTVRGELSAVTRAASGHLYFNLKDDGGQAALLRCAMFRRAAVLTDFLPAEGQRVEVRGRLDLYAPRGELQMVVESMQRVGSGSLYEEFLRLKARLEGLGLFDASRKRERPLHPRTIGVVTSLGAAALRDVLAALARRAPNVRVVVYPSLVQGAEAPPALVAAMQGAALRREVDVLLLVRGGGSLEDLWAFNDERVVRAIVASPVPVICGVGHETDVTLADLAADLRAPTPTAAAELAAPVCDELLAALRARQQALQRAARRIVQTQAQALDHRQLRLGEPGRRVLAQGQRLQALAHRLALALKPALHSRAQAADGRNVRLRTAAATRLREAHAALDARAARLRALDPRQVLSRGYAWVEAEAGPQKGRAIVSARQLGAGQSVRAVWADGAATALVQHVQLSAPDPTSVPAPHAATPPTPAPAATPEDPGGSGSPPAA